MSTSAPRTRIVDAFTGNISEPPTKFFKALSEADHFIAELDGLHELRTRVAELEGALKLAEVELDECRSERNSLASDRIWLQDKLRLASAAADDMSETIAHLIRERVDLLRIKEWVSDEVVNLIRERNNLASDLVDLREAHMRTVADLARARRAGW